MHFSGSEARKSRQARELRRVMHSANANAALWGLGNGLANTTLVIYLAREYNVTGATISLLLAAPSLAGLVRLAAPAWIDRAASRRRFCLSMFLASAAMLASMPVLSAPGVFAESSASVAAMGVAWTTYQALEAIGVVALWAWLGDLAPQRIRGRFIGRREAWMNCGIVVGTVISAAATFAWHRHCQRIDAPQRAWEAYAACGLAGAGTFAAAAVALLPMPDAPRRASTCTVRLNVRSLVAPFVDARMRRFLAFGLWFAFSNGIVQTAQSLYFMGPLGFSLATKKSLDGASRGVQALLLPHIGGRIDRRGNAPILAIAQAAIASAPVFFLLATPSHPWWVLGAYVCWLAYSGHNVALPNLMLGLSRPEATSAGIAAWFAWNHVAYSASVLAGGWLFDWLRDNVHAPDPPGSSLEHFVLLFAASWILKSLGVGLAMRIPEPPRVSGGV